MKLLDLAWPGRHHVYQLVITDTSGQSGTTTCKTFAELSAAIDAAMASPGFFRYEVRPAGDR